MTLYNDSDPFVAAWLRELIADELLPQSLITSCESVFGASGMPNMGGQSKPCLTPSRNISGRMKREPLPVEPRSFMKARLPRFLIEWSQEDKRYNIYLNTGERVGSDPDAACAEIKVGLMGYPPSAIVPPNSWEAEEIRRKATTFGR